ncbi:MULTISPECIES: carbohydrate ABC transporter permease [Dictyoglomus]|jgi:multiple sugar transport system permease protein|uniref:Binding-protein-dependent transport systems inner membrane component n=1 Tax=Dictyoglomus turgidum (strain DSM 6724 / Z-1310) TaxID=515635 RepID=B8E3E0_DICTD|nr:MULTISPECIES: sugar ABC transporter permease [Dictyoglomus]ACK43014.1 binding-protein-dependent transport systems inner membrane component [Dictyoglomus turgidum DSM 6724]PNV80051.1 MAG: sugar ABC transporter permease [Dictyoglomus turgidum]HBU31079.1 sugar ABC transporter permease [Dictyoglomus sp.]
MDKGTRRTAIFMVMPLVFVFLLLTIFPFIYMIVISFMHYNLAEWKAPYFVGLENYVKAFRDEGVHSTLEFTFLLVLLALPIEIILGGFIALFIQNLVGEKVVRSSLLLPMMIPAVVVGVIWKMLFNYEYGPVNYLLSLFGVNKIAWFGDPFFARIAVVIMDVWQWTPFIFLVLYAGLQTVPTDLIEAAKVDGGNRWVIFKYIEFPFLRPLFWILIILRLIDILRMFDIVYMTSFGGPGYATHTLSFYIYKVGISFGWDVGYASALSILLLILVTILTNILIRTMRLWEYLEL